MEEEDISKSCFLCLKVSDFNCEYCSLPYCSKEHYALHRQNEYCFPFRIQYREQLGHHVVSTRDILPLELILEDTPAVFGPDHDTVPVCLECLARVDGSYLCPSCQLPLCGEKCYDKVDGQHRRAECPLLAATPSGVKLTVKFGRALENDGKEVYSPEYHCITPLRLLSRKLTDPELWGRVQLLMDHDSERREESKYWSMFKRNVVDFLTQRLGFDFFTEEEVFRAIGIIRTNAFCIETPAMKAQAVGGRAVFPTFSFLSHSCVGNARYTVVPSNNHVVLRAQRPIPRGEEVTIQYISFMYGHLRRKKDIKACWFFDCGCQRCRDPTEMGSRMSAVRCGGGKDKECCEGDVLPRKDVGDDEDWECMECGWRQSPSALAELCDSLDAKLHETSGHDVLRYERLLQEFLAVLRPTHYLVMTVKKFLGDLYGLTPGFTYAELSKERLERKVTYLREFLEVVGKVDQGCTKWRGLCLHSVIRPILLEANNKYMKNEISKSEFVEAMRSICVELRECLLCLECEPEGTKEAEVARIAKRDLSQIGDIVLFADFI